MMLHYFPTINATLNGLAGVFLFLGYMSIKKGSAEKHRFYMIIAFSVSTIFLCCYLTYHYMKHGVVTRYDGEGIIKLIYYFILITHSFLASIVPFFAVAAVVYAFKRNFQKHKMITRWLYPVWMYVSVTGVLVYLFLYIF